MKIDFLAAFSKSTLAIRPAEVSRPEGEKFGETLGQVLGLDSSQSATISGTQPGAEKLINTTSYNGRLKAVELKIAQSGEAPGAALDSEALAPPSSQLFEPLSSSYLALNQALKEHLEAVKASTNRGSVSDKKAPEEGRVSTLRLAGEAPLASREKISRQEIEELISQHARQTGVDPLLGVSIVAAESSFDPLAVSQDGHYSKGLFQLLDTTGRQLISEVDEEEGSLSSLDRYDPFSPQQNVELGLNYLRKLHDYFSQSTVLHRDLVTEKAANASSLEELAVAAFNAGEGRVAQAQAQAKAAGKDPGVFSQIAEYLPESTVEYVKKVLARRDNSAAALFGDDQRKL